MKDRGQQYIPVFDFQLDVNCFGAPALVMKSTNIFIVKALFTKKWDKDDRITDQFDSSVTF